MFDPATATFIATALATAAKGGSEYFNARKQKKGGKLRAAELHRETLGGLLSGADQATAEHEKHRLESKAKGAKRRSKAMQDTSDLVRGALSI